MSRLFLYIFRDYLVLKTANETANIEVVKTITGHKNSKTIQDHYIHANPELVEKALEITRIDTGLLDE